MKWMISCLLIMTTLAGVGQIPLSTKSKKAIELYTEADNYRVRGQHQQAIDLLNQAIAKDKNFAEAYYRLGLVYYSMRKLPLAIENFETGLRLTTDPRKQKVYWYDLGESYLMEGDYKKAEDYLTRFLQAERQNRPKMERANVLLKNARFGQENEAVSAQYKQKKLSDTVNCFAMQYFPVLTADQQELIFTRRLGNSDDDDEDIVVSRKNSKGQWTAPVSISASINSPFNEGTCTISADGRKIIFTSCLGRRGYGSCDLYQSLKIGNEWTTPENLGDGVNTVDWESQPSLSADGRTLYFVSERRGGYGRRDIWVSRLDENGKWMRAVNAGKQVNTEYDEISPFIHANNRTLYFASNGLPGFGGYDIYFIEKGAEGWSKPVNVGGPVNNSQDQFSLFITADGVKGYYVHEEMTESGYPASELMEIEIPEQFRVKFRSNYVKGVVRDRQSDKPLAARIELININTNEVESIVQSDSISGEYLMVLTQGAEYGLYTSRKGYLFQSQYFNYSEHTDFDPITQDITLDKVQSGSVAVLKNIFFDTDKYEIKEKSVTELGKIVRFLNENPAVRVEISGHTDNTGADAYNRQLSEKRAQAVLDYLVQQGIPAARLQPRGYGSSRPVSANDTEEGRQLNRRIEFRIM